MGRGDRGVKNGVGKAWEDEGGEGEGRMGEGFFVPGLSFIVSGCRMQGAGAGVSLIGVFNWESARTSFDPIYNLATGIKSQFKNQNLNSQIDVLLLLDNPLPRF